jgi:hypothetical protein
VLLMLRRYALIDHILSDVADLSAIGLDWTALW